MVLECFNFDLLLAQFLNSWVLKWVRSVLTIRLLKKISPGVFLCGVRVASHVAPILDLTDILCLGLMLTRKNITTGCGSVWVVYCVTHFYHITCIKLGICCSLAVTRGIPRPGTRKPPLRP